MNYSKVKLKIKTAIIIILSFMLLISSYQVWHIHCKYDMSYKPYRLCYIKNNYNYNYVDHNNYKKLVKREFNTPHILKISSDGFEEHQYAKSSPLFRIVIMKNVQYGINNVKAYAHELAHVKYQTLNDCFATYKAITTLYESENEMLKYVAINYANDVLQGGYEGNEYDCGYYLIEYFKGKENIILI